MDDKNSLFSAAARPVPARIRRAIRRMVGRPLQAIQEDLAYVRACGLFDAEYYLGLYPDVASAGLDPVEHYVRHGAAEKRAPSAWFSTAHYLKHNPDVAAAGVNPLRHYCENGGAELRDPSPGFDAAWYWLTYMAGPGVQGNPLVHYLSGGRERGNQVRGHGELSPSDRVAMAAACDEFIDRGGCGVPLLQALARTMLRIGRPDIAERALREVAAVDWDQPRHHVALADVLALQRKWWLVVESLEAATALDASQAEWFFRLGDAREMMNRFDAAADAYRKAIALSKRKAEWQYRLGHALERAGESRSAADAYALAMEYAGGEVARFGVGVYHQKRGYWGAARDAYMIELERSPVDAELHYRLGMAHDRLYDWQEALTCYENAIALSGMKQVAQWHFRMGFVLERLQRWDEAANAYAAASALRDKHVSYWHYRRGYVLDRAGNHEAACLAYLDARQESWQQPDESPLARYLAKFDASGVLSRAAGTDMVLAASHARLADNLLRTRDWEGAARAYAAALARSSAHEPAWYYRLGLALSRQGRHRDACDAFRQLRILQRPHGVSEAEFERNEDLRVTTSYVEYRDCLPVRGDVILYESFNGNSMTCNPLAIFKELVRDPAYRGFLHVWVLNDLGRVREELRECENVVFVQRGSDGYLRYLATAGFLINNSGFPPYFMRRPEQKYLATWHGTPLKTLGKEQKYKFYDHKRTQRNYLQATHIISPNGHTSGIMLDSYDIRPLYTGLFAETGYPRIDMTLNATDAEKARMRARMGLSADKPIVLYAPTWRGTLDEVEFDTTRLESDLAKLAGLGCQVIFRGHSLLERVLGADDVSCTVVPADIDSNELLSIVDVLITDYSSIFFDYLPTGRPVIYYIYDVEEYERERGLYFRMDEMPGFKCRTIEDVGEAVRSAIAGGVGDRSQYERSRAAYNPHDDGHATRRTVDFFFGDALESALEYSGRRKRSIVLHGGSFQPNGITTSFTNLVNKLDREADDVVVAMAPSTIEVSEACVAQFGKLPRDVYVVPRYGNMPVTLEERWLRKCKDNGLFQVGREGDALLSNAHAREFRRIFGPKQYDAVVAFSGYDAFWASILLANGLPMRKAAYLHNDMYSEHVHRFPELARMFGLYAHADALVSVSWQTSEHNRENLAARYGLADDKFVFCENVSNAEEIIEKAGRPLESADDEGLFDGGGPVFINIARLSVEKDQEKLIRAFAEFRRRNLGARLLILGTGPLGHHLGQVCQQLGVTGCVHLLGFRANPYAYLRRADCFVLSSNHEGQPMTLLEALVLSKPVLATDIVGNRSVMEGRGGMLVENSEAGLVAGMQAFVEGGIQVSPFDWRAYNRVAIGHFYERVVAGAAMPAPETAHGDD